MTEIDKDRPYQICTRCAMDTTIPSIRFDKKGVCNFCDMHDELEKKYPLSDAGRKDLDKIVRKIKEDGKGKSYDVICGTSGGRDSTWTLYLTVKKLGLRPLVVHFDNGWNSAIAVKNIFNTCRILDIDLETYVVDWEEFRNIQLSFLRASTSDVEVPTDVAIHSILHKYANEENVGYIFNGHSFRTEGIAPLDWTYMDGRYISSVQKQFGAKDIQSFPNFSLWDYINYSFLNRIKVIPVLNYFPYDQGEVGRILETELDWEYYGGHHHESFYTEFIQSYLLPRKFNVDRRRTELSALIRSDYRTRDEALTELSKEYEYRSELIDYSIEKLQISKSEWDELYNNPPKSFRDYPSYYPYIRMLKWPLWIATKLGIVDRIIYLKFLG